jgi:polyisoprenoid-binding protein YceI
MKKISFSLLLFAAFAMMAMATNPVEGQIDLEKSTVTWKGKKVTGKHHGIIKLKEATLDMNDGMLNGGSFTIDMQSLENSDLSGNMKGKLEGHLKSADFFNVAEFPTATLNLTKVSSRGTPGDFKVTGDLTIKGITKPIKFNAHIGESEGMMVAEADIMVDRSEYDVRYGSGSFFDNLGDKTIYDEFELSVKLVLK